MISGKKYVPPHLRSSQGSGGNYDSDNGNVTGDSGRGGRYRGGYNSESRGGRGGRGSYRGGRGGYNADERRGNYGSYGGNDRRSNDSVSTEAPPVGNSRWSNVQMDGDNRRSGGDVGGGRGYPQINPRRNERGFHGDLTPDKRLEARLFDNSDKQTTGINFDNYDKIPIEVSGDNIPNPIDSYSAETIGEDLYRNTQLCGYSKPTPVQKYSVPIGQEGRDLMACAQTGSGKTAGFLFPIIMAMIRVGGRDPPASSGRRITYPETLVLAPTRELAQQIYEEARRFCYCTGIATVCIYGGADVRDQLKSIDRGCDLLVATPGRLVDLIERGRLGMDNVHFLVLDEADRMLDMGFEVSLNSDILFSHVLLAHHFCNL
jgi:ATP-dependent RNA helicase DDX3X